jgi:tetratricopeptide (TPR) repeat protein
VLRLVGFFLLAAILVRVLGHLPLIGPLFDHTGLIGILLAAGLISAVLTRIGERLYQARKLRSELRTLAAVGNAHHHGKLGTLYLSRGHAREARVHLEDAVRGEPELAEWRYRLGLACLATGDPGAALAAFEQCVAREEEHAYGAAQMRRAESLLRLERGEESLAALALFEQNHGPSPESAYRRGLALRALRRRPEARAAFAEVGELARRATRYQRRSASSWALRAGLARLV